MTYDWYFDALAGKHPPIVESEPQPGFYRMRGEIREGFFRDGIPVAIWHDEDEGVMVAMIGDAETCPAIEVWMDVAARPIKEEYYRAFVETGQWPDDPFTKEKTAPATNRSNAPTKREELSDEIDSATAITLKPIIDDASRDAAQALRARLLELKGKAEKEHKKEKQPSLDAGREVDEAWKPMVKKAETAAVAIRTALSKYETDQHNARKAAEEAARKAMESQEDIPEILRRTETPPPVPQETRIKGAYGRSASRQVKRVAVIVNIAETAKWYLQTDEMKVFLTGLAQRDLDRGQYVPPGVDAREEVEVR